MSKSLFFMKYVVFTVFVIGTIVSICLRITELLHEIDQTGFYISGSVVVPVLNGILIGMVIVLLLPFLLKNQLPIEAFTGKSVITSIIAFLLGLALCFDSASQLFFCLVKPDLGTFVITITELLAAIFFFILSNQKYSGKKMNLSGPALFPVIWSIIILGVSFMRYTSIANISELLFDVLKMVFVLVFTYYNARIVGNIANNKESKGVISFGLTAALFCLISTVPNIVAWFIDPSKSSLSVTSDLVYILFAVYIIDVVVEALFLKHGNIENILPVEVNDELDEEKQESDEQ